jgi:hypothetical protein
VNSTIQSTKSAGPLAAAWVTLRAMGAQGYLRAYAAQLEATRRIVDAVEGAPGLGLRVLGEPAASLVALASDVLDVGAVADAMRARGWHLQTQLPYGAAPASLHLTVDVATAATVGDMLADLADACAQVRSDPPPASPRSWPPPWARSRWTGHAAGPWPAAGRRRAGRRDRRRAGARRRVSAMLQAMERAVRPRWPCSSRTASSRRSLGAGPLGAFDRSGPVADRGNGRVENTVSTGSRRTRRCVSRGAGWGCTRRAPGTRRVW